jgi:hypothetical protein
MTYVKPEVVVLGKAAKVIQSSKQKRIEPDHVTKPGTLD